MVLIVIVIDVVVLKSVAEMVGGTSCVLDIVPVELMFPTKLVLVTLAVNEEKVVETEDSLFKLLEAVELDVGVAEVDTLLADTLELGVDWAVPPDVVVKVEDVIGIDISLVEYVKLVNVIVTDTLLVETVEQVIVVGTDIKLVENVELNEVVGQAGPHEQAER